MICITSTEIGIIIFVRRFNFHFAIIFTLCARVGSMLRFLLDFIDKTCTLYYTCLAQTFCMGPLCLRIQGLSYRKFLIAIRRTSGTILQLWSDVHSSTRLRLARLAQWNRGKVLDLSGLKLQIFIKSWIRTISTKWAPSKSPLAIKRRIKLDLFDWRVPFHSLLASFIAHWHFYEGFTSLDLRWSLLLP